MESEQDMEDLPETVDEPEVAVSTATADGVNIPLPMRHSTREIRALRRLIKEL